MQDDVKLPTDAKLSEADVKRVLERAVQIDGAQTVVTVTDLAQAAHEAGISENAMLQAVQELLQDREMVSPADPSSATSGEARVKSVLWLRTAAFGLLLVIALMVIYFLGRVIP
jgi:hypothetical protein